jgi:ABC-2 type transport system permease protein
VASVMTLNTGRYGTKQVLYSELTKIRSLRSTWWTLLITVVGTLGVTVLATGSAGHHPSGWYMGFDPTSQSMSGLILGVLAIGVLGVLSITGEYGTGTIRSSLMAAPRRPLLLMGKTLVIGAVTLVVGEFLTFACFGVGQAILAAGDAPHATLSQPGVLRAIALSGVFVAFLGLLGLGLGAVIRNTAGAISAFAGATYLLPIVLGKLPGSLGRFTPVEMLANSVSYAHPQSGQVSPALGVLLMVLYCTIVLSIGVGLMIRRDA